MMARALVPLACLLTTAVAAHVDALEDEFACSTNLLQTRSSFEAPAASKRRDEASAPGLFVLDVSAPRSGTQSFYSALKTLGLNPVHTGYDRSLRVPLENYLFRNGSKEEALKTLDGHNAAMDEPYHLMYKEIMEAYPEAKFVLHPVHSTPQAWYKSVVKVTRTAYCMNTTSVEGLDDYVSADSLIEGPVYNSSLDPNAVSDYGLFHYWNCHFDHAVQTPDEVHACLDMYVAHEQAVRREIPAEKLLVFDMKEGWAPLCSFLGLPEPKEPFPHVDDFKEPIALCKFMNAFNLSSINRGYHR